MTSIREFSKRRIASWIVVAAALACHSDQPARKPAGTPVRVAAAARIDAPVNISASGVVEPMQTVAVTSQVSGTLEDVLFREGETVQAGQVLFRIDPRPLQASLDQARATLARDEAQADAGRRDDARYQALASKGYVSRSQADQVHATALAQQATVEADRAALRSATVSLGYATIHAPISGRTGSLLVRRGNIVTPAAGPLVVINQLRPVLVRFPVADQDFPAVQRALATHPLPVIATVSDSTQASERGQLSFLDNAIDSLTGTLTGKATFPNAGSRLWPGELVFLTVQLDVQRGVLAVPNEAVLTGQDGSYVYVVDAKNTAQTRNVVTGLQVGDVTVVGQGLAEGERVVVDGQSRLNPGARVSLVGNGADSSGRSLSVTSGGGAGSAGGEVTGVATPNGGAQNRGARGGGGAGGGEGSLTNGGVAGDGATGARGGRLGTSPAPSMTGATGVPGGNGAGANGSPNAASSNGARTGAANAMVSGGVTTGVGTGSRSPTGGRSTITTTTTTRPTTPTTTTTPNGAGARTSPTTGTRPITAPPTGTPRP
jgi:membrane fusion protein, multidrug efflux system